MVEIIGNKQKNSKGKNFLIMALLVVGGILINFGFSYLVKIMEWPIYLDSIGTIIASILGGYLPGIIIGILSPMINVFNDPAAVSYGMLNVMIAVVTVWFYRMGWFKSVLKTIATVFIYAFIGGVLGTILTWFLYGFAAEDTSAGLVHYIYSMGVLGPFGSQLVADYLIDLLDKAINLLVAGLVIKFLPASFRNRFNIHIWKQTPITDDALTEVRKPHSRLLSLRIKVMVALSGAAILIAAVSIGISYVLYKETIIDSGIPGGVDMAYSFLARQISMFFGVFVLIVAIGLYMVEYWIILPLNTMALTADYFVEEEENNKTDDDAEEEALQSTVELFKALNIYTGDEIENLYQSFSGMTEENLEFVRDIRDKNDKINEMQNALIIVLADMVESRDENTGDHIKKTAAYTKIIMDEMKEEGVYVDKLTDEFVDDVIRSAPLHDIGKISVSDVVLNKPGKLTDEEFAIMKGHTTAGASIIEQVMETVPDGVDEYLKEARNLALYHHEKWNGAGYPEGISGEEIPLSARIMAVADVFDALVSRRSYKEPFTYEKAFSIIEEGSGSHFDPKVAGAFLNAREKVTEVADRVSKKEAKS